MPVASNPTKVKLQRPPDVWFSSLQLGLNAVDPALTRSCVDFTKPREQTQSCVRVAKTAAVRICNTP